MGPSIDFVVRRTSLASEDLYKEACKQPKAAKVIFISFGWQITPEFISYLIYQLISSSVN